jgi:hypothetical protein
MPRICPAFDIICVPSGVVRKTNITIMIALIKKPSSGNAKKVPISSSEIPNEVVFVVECMRIYKSVNLSIPMDDIKINTDPKIRNIKDSHSSIHQPPFVKYLAIATDAINKTKDSTITISRYCFLSVMTITIRMIPRLINARRSRAITLSGIDGPFINLISTSMNDAISIYMPIFAPRTIIVVLIE